MYRKILAALLALILLGSLPMAAFGEETVETTEVTEPSRPESRPTEVTEATETTLPPETTVPIPDISVPTFLEIDSTHIYNGMEEAYEYGYSPSVDGGMMYLILPLRTNGKLYRDELKASLGLGGSSGTPFVMANYEKTFSLETVMPENSDGAQEIFLIAFEVTLSENRTNGVYPVTVNVSAYDEANNAISAVYTLYVTITDGKSTEVKTTYPEVATAEPVVYISNTTLEPEKAMAGEEFTLTVTLKNSVTTKSVRNLLVTVDPGNAHINLLEDSNIFQISEIPAGGETALTLRFSGDAALPAGKYPIGFSFRYDSSKTLNLSSSGTTMVEICQPANMELVMPRFSDSVTVGDTIPLSLQVMNMGRDPMYNVRCTVSGYGFAPSNTGYIGTMAAGSSATTKVELYIIALNTSSGNENGNQYGDTEGTVTLTYENENGEEFSQETTFHTTVNRPIVQLPQTDTAQEEEKATAWWTVVLAMGLGILLALGGMALGNRKKNRTSP